MLAVYIVVTIFGGVVLVLFLILVGLLYWMNARMALPTPAHLIHPHATAYVIADLDRTLPKNRVRTPGLAGFLCDGTPAQIRNLVAKGIGNPKCDVTVVASFHGATGRGEMSLAVSLGRYPGMFRLVRRDIERRSKKGLLPASLSYHNRKAIFHIDQNDSPLRILSLAGCTLLRTHSIRTMRIMLDQLNAGKYTVAMPAEDEAFTGDDVEGCHFSGWAAQWRPDFLKTLPNHETVETLRSVLGKLSADLPAVLHTRDIRFFGTFGEAGETKLKLSFVSADKEDAGGLAEALPGWLKENARALGIKSSRARALAERVELTLTMDPTGE